MNATIPLCKRRCEKEWANTPKVKYLKGDYLGWLINDEEVCV